MWGLVWLVALQEKELQAIVDQGQVEEKTVSSQAISTMADNLDAALGIISVQPSQNLVVRETVGPLHDGVRGCPGFENLVVILYFQFPELAWRRTW